MLAMSQLGQTRHSGVAPALPVYPQLQTYRCGMLIDAMCQYATWHARVVLPELGVAMEDQDVESSLWQRAESVNGRIIRGTSYDGQSRWSVEIRGPAFEGTDLQVWWPAGETLVEAQQLALRLGPLPCEDETDKAKSAASKMNPDLTVDVTLYPTAEGGRHHPILGAWFSCPCKLRKDDFDARDCRLLLNGQTMSPGETRRLGIKFLSDDSAPIFRDAGRFYLWEGKIIGEAVVVPTAA
jgi:hypothetical protein